MSVRRRGRSLASRAGGAAVALLILLSPASLLHAQSGRSYHYDRIDADITVNTDDTFRVIERQTYDFVGTYHQGYRAIPHAKIGALTDITVTDGATGQPLIYSPSRLDKTSPASWGKYTTYTDNGTTVIEWYYDVSYAKHEWDIAYTVHDGLGFYKDHDEIYWNLFTDYDVGVDTATALVHLPGADTLPTATWYTSDNVAKQANLTRPDDSTFLFTASNFGPQEKATIAAGWQKGLIDEQAPALIDDATIYLIALSVLLLSILFSIGYWYFTERYHAGRGTVVPQYEPPQHLPPAMAELIVKERLTPKSWPATLVDLAIRGYVRIEEDPPKTFDKVIAVIIWILGIGGLGAIGFFLLSDHVPAVAVLIMLAMIILVFWIRGMLPIGRALMPKDYLIYLDESKDRTVLKSYESGFLILLCPGKEPFSTRDARNSTSSKQALYLGMKDLEKETLGIVDTDTGAYEHSLMDEWKFKHIGFATILIIGLFLFTAFIISAAHGVVIPIPLPYLALIASAGLSILLIWYMTKFEARLTKEGQILREDWLGFKLYLSTAERYRMQNLTPDLFEKYLPYAMIFGIEKKWARAFEGLNLPPPSWYHGAAYASTFSPVSFSSSLGSSFSSSFASTGAGGASGGGGSAGGGGGGGGGGAS